MEAILFSDLVFEQADAEKDKSHSRKGDLVENECTVHTHHLK